MPVLVYMSERPEDRSKDSKKTAEDNIEQPLDKQDPTEPAKVGGAKEGKVRRCSFFIEEVMHEIYLNKTSLSFISQL